MKKMRKTKPSKTKRTKKIKAGAGTRGKAAPSVKAVKKISGTGSYKDTLVDMKRELIRGMRTNEENGKEGDQDEVRDLADQASDSYDRELAFGLSEAERSRLEEVEDALNRISAKKYGICEICKKPISSSRLKALPFAKLCVECKAKEERG
jgi:DnaK suppressor protein